MAKKAKNTAKQGNFQITFEKLNEERRLREVTSEITQTNEFGYFMNSIQRLELVELYDEIVDDIRLQYLNANPKVKKVSDEAKLNIESLARHTIFELLDTALYDREHGWNMTAELLLNNYFFTEEKVVAAVSAAFIEYGKEIETEVFRPKMSYDVASSKTHKLIGTNEWDKIIVPSEVKFGIANIKSHLEIYLWDEYIKSEYHTFKLAGHSDEEIIDILNNEQSIIGFCAWCEGYREGVEQAKAEKAA